MQKITTYAIHQGADYQVRNVGRTRDGQSFAIVRGDESWISARYHGLAEVQLYSLTAAAVVADVLGIEQNTIAAALPEVPVVSGRLQILAGINGSTIIDDTYNASPEAVIAALNMLYQLDAPAKVALLGNMNELGNYSPEAHTRVGRHTDSTQLKLVVTLGPDANAYLADAAEAKGCTVVRVQTPYEAAEKIKPHLVPGAILLAKGSQNGVFAEETVKLLLANPADQSRLVRQSAAWLKKKAANFQRTQV